MNTKGRRSDSTVLLLYVFVIRWKAQQFKLQIKRKVLVENIVQSSDGKETL